MSELTAIRDWRQAETALTALLGLKRRPVGVRLLKTMADYAASPALEPISGLPYCVAVEKATAGCSYKMDIRHDRCAASAIAFGMMPVTEERASGELHMGFGVYKNLNISRSVMDDMVYCEEENCGVEVRPLADCEEEPDIVLLILQPKAAMRLIQGYAYHFGQLKNIKMAGMCAICQESTSYPLARGQVNVSLLCSGTRCVGRWQDDELAAGIPVGQLRQIIDGIWNTVDPMESETDKRSIAARLTEAGLEVPNINYKKNYYTGSYRLPKINE